MFNLRFKLTILSSWLMIIYAVPKANYMIKHKDRYTQEECYNFACKMANKMRIHSHTNSRIYGISNVPLDETFVLYPNHQGKYDALGVALSVPTPISVLFEKKQASRLLARQVCGLLEASIIDHTDDRDKVRAIRQATEQVAAGVNYVIFLEGGYSDNKNTLQEFYTGALNVTLRTKTTIVPVCLYDSYKSMNSNSIFNKVWTEVHYLKPIPYDEYKDLKKQEIAELIKSRIQERLDLIEAGDVDETYFTLPYNYSLDKILKLKQKK